MCSHHFFLPDLIDFEVVGASLFCEHFVLCSSSWFTAITMSISFSREYNLLLISHLNLKVYVHKPCEEGALPKKISIAFSNFFSFSRFSFIRESASRHNRRM